MVRTPLSGTPHVIRSGLYEAEIASVGATLRTLRHGDRDLVLGFDADEVRPGYRGATLAPWPNRVIDGRYTFRGRAHRLALTEPERGHALHGLAVWADFHAVEAEADRLVLAAVVPAQVGYPWRLVLTVTYALDVDGLAWSVRAVNESADAAPFGTGPHPYLVAGPGSVDDWTFELPARAVLGVTEDRLVPTSVHDVRGDARFDFLSPRPLGATELDHAYTDLLRDEDGSAEARVTDDTGRGVSISWDERSPWVQVHTADRPGAAGHRAGLAVEPMTCPPDAFNSGVDLAVIEPGASFEAGWRIAAIEPD